MRYVLFTLGLFSALINAEDSSLTFQKIFSVPRNPAAIAATPPPELLPTIVKNVAVDSENNTYVWNGYRYANYIFDDGGKAWMSNPQRPGTRIQIKDPEIVNDLRRFWTQWPLAENSLNERILRPFLGLPETNGKPSGLVSDGKWLYWKAEDKSIRRINIDPDTGRPFFSDGTTVSEALITAMQDVYSHDAALSNLPLVEKFNENVNKGEPKPPSP